MWQPYTSAPSSTPSCKRRRPSATRRALTWSPCATAGSSRHHCAEQRRAPHTERRARCARRATAPHARGARATRGNARAAHRRA
eukprot:3903479-Pleurochrysis_carterae.AAC.1